MLIPKIIHQVWEGRTEPRIPLRLQILARTWQEHNPDWEYHLWSGKEMDRLVENYFPEYLSMYRGFKYNVQRWDTIRYMILYIYGGIYTDLDTECFKPIESLVKDITIGIGEEPPIIKNQTCLGNAFMVSEKNNPIWLKILEEIKSYTIKEESCVLNVMNTTGSFMLERLYNKINSIVDASELFNYYDQLEL